MTSGTFNNSAADSFGSWFIDLTGSNFQLRAFSARWSTDLVPSHYPLTANQVVTFDYSGVVDSFHVRVNAIDFTLDGVTYSLYGPYIVRFVLTFTGVPQSTRAVCTACPSWWSSTEAEFPDSTFAMTGTILIWRQDDPSFRITTDIVGNGTATAYALDSADRISSYSTSRFTFIPEPSTALLLFLPLLAVGVKRLIRHA